MSNKNYLYEKKEFEKIQFNLIDAYSNGLFDVLWLSWFQIHVVLNDSISAHINGKNRLVRRIEHVGHHFDLVRAV